MNMNAPITRVTWRIYAPEADMVAAEKAVFPDWTYHLSELDWFAADPDDERPDNCERFIEMRPADPEHTAGALKVMAVLGAKARLCAWIESEHFHADIDTDGNHRAYIRPDKVNAILEERISQAVRILWPHS